MRKKNLKIYSVDIYGRVNTIYSGLRGRLLHTEMIVRTHESFEKEIKEFEGKKTGDAKADEMIDRFLEPYRAKQKTLEIMYEIETGKKMFAD